MDSNQFEGINVPHKLQTAFQQVNTGTTNSTHKRIANKDNTKYFKQPTAKTGFVTQEMVMNACLITSMTIYQY